jgi:hypothetical protein
MNRPNIADLKAQSAKLKAEKANTDAPGPTNPPGPITPPTTINDPVPKPQAQERQASAEARL